MAGNIWAEFSDMIVGTLELDTEPVAVFLLKRDQDRDRVPVHAFQAVTGHRYCQALMRARHGEAVLIEPGSLACPAASAVFGFKDLPATLASGQGLVGFGIVSKPDTGREMFEGMLRLPPGTLAGIALCPLASAPALPDVVVVEGPPEPLMWLALADVNRSGGQRRSGDTAVLQGTCVDATLIPYLEQRLNFSLGCYGCREATDLAPSEAVLGFPGALLEPLAQSLRELNVKAIPRSRSKSVWRSHVAASSSERQPS